MNLIELTLLILFAVVKVLRHECLDSDKLSVDATCHHRQMAARAHFSEQISCHCSISSSTCMVISGFWVGPDIEDGWGFIEAFVNYQMCWLNFFARLLYFSVDWLNHSYIVILFIVFLPDKLYRNVQLSYCKWEDVNHYDHFKIRISDAYAAASASCPVLKISISLINNH